MFHWPREDIMLADPNSYRFVWWEVKGVNGFSRSPVGSHGSSRCVESHWSDMSFRTNSK